jgi:hypothetical protein
MLGAIRGLFSLAKQSSPDGEEHVHWVVIAIAIGIEGEVFRSKLESENIPCLLKRESVGSVIGITLGPLGETQVLVPQEYAEQAILLLNEGAPEEDGEDFSSDDAAA